MESKKRTLKILMIFDDFERSKRERQFAWRGGWAAHCHVSPLGVLHENFRTDLGIPISTLGIPILNGVHQNQFKSQFA